MRKKNILKSEYKQKKCNLKVQTNIKPKSAMYTCNLKNIQKYKESNSEKQK